MGSFFTNVHVRIPDGVEPTALADRLRAVVEKRIADEGFAITDGPADREILIAPAGRWLAFYDARTEDQDDTVEVWARALSQALETEAFSVLVHDSDVLALALFAHGKQRDRFDSNPGFSGKKPSKVTAEARAAKWASIVAPGHDAAELAATFASKHVFAEAALTLLAPAIGAKLDALRTGYNYLTRDGEVPPNVVRVRAKFAERPPWEQRLSGPPLLASQWEQFGMKPPAQEPQRVLVGRELRVSAIVKNRGGAARGLRIAIELSSECGELTQVEAVISKPGRFEMDRHTAQLVRVDGRWVAEIPDALLQPGFGGDPSALVGAPMDAMMDAHHAGQIYVNILGTARHAGRATLAVEVVPLANPAGSHVERVVVEVTSPRGVPLRASDELHPHELDRLTGDTHSYLLVLLDAPIDRIKAHALALLASVRSLWPKGQWHAFASDERYEVGDELQPKGANAWPVLEKAIRATKGRVTATLAPRSSYDTTEACGFEVNVREELGAIAIWLARDRTDQPAVERALTAAVDAIAHEGALVQATLARWQIDGGGVTTPYEDVVRIHGDHTATRGWATTWLRAIGRGQLWLGHALHNRVAAALSDIVELGPAIRIPVTDVAATEALLASLLPTADQSHEYDRSLRTAADD